MLRCNSFVCWDKGLPILLLETQLASRLGVNSLGDDSGMEMWVRLQCETKQGDTCQWVELGVSPHVVGHRNSCFLCPCEDRNFWSVPPQNGSLLAISCFCRRTWLLGGGGALRQICTEPSLSPYKRVFAFLESLYKSLQATSKCS